MKKLLAVVVLLAAPAVQAHEVAVKLLGNAPLSTVSTPRGAVADGSGAAGFALEYLARPFTNAQRLAVGAELSLLPRSEVAVDPVLGPAVELKTSGETLAVLGLLRYDLIKAERFTAYAAGGLGLANVSRRATGRPINGATWSAAVGGGGASEKVLVDSSELVPAYAVRGGFDVLVGKRVVLGAEVGYVGTGEARHGPTTEGAPVLGTAFSAGGASESLVMALRAGVRF